MTQREKLINLIYNTQHMTDISEVVDHLLANGVIVPSVKVGDTVYEFWSPRRDIVLIDEVTVIGIGFDTGSEYYEFDDFGERVFLTREEAEAALKECERG